MFRPLRRKNKEIDISLAKSILVNERRGVLAVNGDGNYPYAIPINYLYDEENNKIYFHGALAGHKYDSIKANDKVCFTVYGNEEIREETWAPYMQSVVAFGRCSIIEDRALAIKLVKKMAMKYYPEESLADDEIEKSGNAFAMFQIDIEHFTGKEIQEK